jgi:NADH-quinone oxidoreductase subunit E
VTGQFKHINTQKQFTRMFTPDELKQVEDIAKRYPVRQAALMPVLYMAQKKFGYLSLDTIRHVADLLKVPHSHALGVVSFYTMYHTKPTGKYHIQVCTNVSCMLCGGENLFQHISNRIGIDNLEMTPDGRFSLEEVECMGSCGGAPMIAINDDYYENISTEKIDELLVTLK